MTSNLVAFTNEADVHCSDSSSSSNDKAKPVKRAKLSSDAGDGPKLPDQECGAVQTSGEPEDNPKKKRHWESWDMADKDVFFEGLSEFGKDFDKINTYMKNKRREEAKNKDQIRHFYYRTWNKIAKGLPIESDKDKKGNHEVLGLLCYGELRKKGVRGFGVSQMKKLEELVKQGVTSLRYKGRRCKVKPPNCKALKRIHEQLVDRGNVTVIPKKINVELSPRTNSAWCIAHKLCCNPRLRCTGVPAKVWMLQLFSLLERKLCGCQPFYEATTASELLHIYSSTVDKEENQTEKTLNAPNVLVFDSNGSLDLRSAGVSNMGLNTSLLLGKDETQDKSSRPITRGCQKENALPDSIAEHNNSQMDMAATGKDACEHQTSAVQKDDSNDKEDTTSTLACWTKDNCNITVGALFAEYGKSDIVELYYDWPTLSYRVGDLPESVNSLARLAHCEIRTPTSKQVPASRRGLMSTESSEFCGTLAGSTLRSISPRQLHPKHAFIVPNIPQDRLTLVNSCSTMKTTARLDLPKAHRRGRTPRNSISPSVIQRTIVPRPSNSKKLIPSAVAVNIVRQPAQLVQLAQRTSGASQLVNQEARDPVQIPGNIATSLATSSMPVLSRAVTTSLGNLMSQAVSVQVVAEGHAPAVSLSQAGVPLLCNTVLQASSAAQATPTTASNKQAPPNALAEIDLSFLQTLGTKHLQKTAANNNMLALSSSQAVPGGESSNDSTKTSHLLTTPLKSMLETPTKVFEGSSSQGTSSSPLKIPLLNFDQQWLGGEMADISLGSFLGSFGSDQAKPVQISQQGGEPVGNGKEDSNTGFPLFKANQSGSSVGLDFMLDENSVDYINRFREMTARLAADGTASRANGLTTTVASERLYGSVPASKKDFATVTTSLLNTAGPVACVDARLPVCQTEDSIGPLDGLSFVLPSTESRN